MHTRLSRAHCDIAARSCLIGECETVKLINLGNSMIFTDTTKMMPISQKTLLPIRWSAPEVISITIL